MTSKVAISGGKLAATADVLTLITAAAEAAAFLRKPQITCLFLLGRIFVQNCAPGFYDKDVISLMASACEPLPNGMQNGNSLDTWCACLAIYGLFLLED